ncbi:ShlB/FhaC/HecB family hemolysin secretion/activation protein [Paraburkholderia bryophila]|uniref:Hemolysin activation/secretion protein n=1 Tax=Paraburkholderia bryophila TaxID=420952 RepID=A0A7Z0BB04_9BURK|nr:ShlB/FhaC/HecB family hemolysin secretion/activation protein [Paraburkholderia bryophila]NYH25927.1 hemolysin activation/secretion protein [Paraburkholderia bryophila]
MAAAASATADDGFTITRFEVEGNSLLPADEVQHLLQPMSGPHRVYGDIQHALEALESAYRKAAYTAVQVSVPEQELTSGIVRIQVTENRIGKITVTGNRHFSDKNVLAGLPPLRSGQSPNLRAISEAVQLSNDNPAKQVGVTLSSGNEPGTVDAEVKVTDENPLHVFATVDNSGAASTGRWRTGVAIQDANLFDLDQVGTLAYTTSPDSPSGVRVNVYSVGYRIPLYRLGDSLEFLYGKSSINTPSSSPTLGGLLGFTGKGDIYGFRWNHFFARRGETTSKLVVGLDYKKIDSTCNVNGVEISTAGPTPPVASCVPYTTVPLSLTYVSQTRSIGQSIDYDLGISRNLATGSQYTNTDGRTDRYSYLTPGSRDTVDGFMILHGDASITRSFANDWQWRLASSAQATRNPLVSSEQFGLVGMYAVRGFTERAVTADSGVFFNAELYTPQLVSAGNLRLLAFVDYGHGHNSHVGSSGIPANLNVSSMGVGARYVFGRNVSLRLDVARVDAAGHSLTEKRGDIHADVSASLGF